MNVVVVSIVFGTHLLYCMAIDLLIRERHVNFNFFLFCFQDIQRKIIAEFQRTISDSSKQQQEERYVCKIIGFLLYDLSETNGERIYFKRMVIQLKP